jgi:hypothetical protein
MTGSPAVPSIAPNIRETVSQYDTLIKELLGFWDSGILGFWDSGILGFWDSGILGFWDSGIPDFWTDRGIVSLTPVDQRSKPPTLPATT